MKTKGYESHFQNAFYDLKEIIDEWKVDETAVQSWMNLKGANMIFVPKLNGGISKSTFFCTLCRKWLSINGSVRNICRHANIHIPDIMNSHKKTKASKEMIFTGKQEEFIITQIISFILLSTQTFQYTDNEFLKKISEKLPNRKRITNILETIAKSTNEQIKSSLVYSSSNSITFDGWTSKGNMPYIGITVRALIGNDYKDFFLDLIDIENIDQSSKILALNISQSLENYGLSSENIVSCTTDNCNNMVTTAEYLNIWRIPCVVHMLNLIFEEFVKSSKATLLPFLKLYASLNRSTKYTIFTEPKNIKKVPSYIETRWTSLCQTILVFLETKEDVIDFCMSNKKDFPNKTNLKKKKNLMTYA